MKILKWTQWQGILITSDVYGQYKLDKHKLDNSENN